VWVVSALVGNFVQVGLPSINSLVLAFVLYVVAGKLGLVRGYGVSRTEAGTEPSTAAAPATAVVGSRTS
jgi:cytosine permease